MWLAVQAIGDGHCEISPCQCTLDAGQEDPRRCCYAQRLASGWDSDKMRYASPTVPT
jgi:hypothetical protein